MQLTGFTRRYGTQTRLIHGTLTILSQIFPSHLIVFNELVVLLRHYPNIVVLYFKLKQSDGVALHHLGGYWSTDKCVPPFHTQGDILFKLHSSDLIAFRFGLHGHNVLRPAPVNAHVDLVGFDLPDTFNGGPQMVLQRIASYAQEDVYQAIVA